MTADKNGERNKIFLFFKEIISIAKENKFHFVWFFLVFVFAFLSIWIVFFMEGAQACYERIKTTSDLYIIAVGVLAPCLFDLLVSIIEERKYKIIPHFVGLKILLFFIGFVFVFFTPFLAIGYYKTHTYLKLILTFFSLLFSFICYLTKYLSFPKHSSVDDKTYHDEEKKESHRMIEEAISTNKATINGDDVKV